LAEKRVEAVAPVVEAAFDRLDVEWKWRSRAQRRAKRE
jgi:hypothetical protein